MLKTELSNPPTLYLYRFLKKGVNRYYLTTQSAFEPIDYDTYYWDAVSNKGISNSPTHFDEKDLAIMTANHYGYHVQVTWT